jgi:hypothetical protein
VLRALADRGCRTLGRGISTDGLVSDDVHALVDDGIIREDEGGGRVTFEHDIFFEWSFFQVCSSRGDQWLSAIVEAGEIPQLGRVVELLSQARFERRDRWADHLRIVESAAARSQWNRAWLLAPFSSPLFPERENTFADAIDNGPPVRFSQLLVWFQAVRTTEHPGVLSGEIGGPTLTRLQRLRLADSLSWPRDMPAWRRLTRWVIDRIGRLSGDAIPDVLTVFDVWLNAFPGRTDPITQSIRGLAKEWLAEIESVSHPETFLRIRPVTRWEGMTLLSPEELESTLRAAFLRTAICVPALIRDYLMSVAARPRVRHHVLDQLLMWSPRFAEVCPGALVDLCLAEFLEPLPSKTAENVRGHRIGAWSPHSSEWHSPSIKDDLTGFRPASPTRQPFHSLFQSAPQEALRLVQGNCRHMMTAWRELHRYDWHHREIPLAIRLEFPWGVEEYWGNRQVYLWYRGAFACGRPLSISRNAQSSNGGGRRDVASGGDGQRRAMSPPPSKRTRLRRETHLPDATVIDRPYPDNFRWGPFGAPRNTCTTSSRKRTAEVLERADPLAYFDYSFQLVRDSDSGTLLDPSLEVENLGGAWSSAFIRSPVSRRHRLAVWTSTDPDSMRDAVRDIVARTDPSVAVGNVMTMESMRARHVSPYTLRAGMMSVLAMVTITIAAVGLYGLIAYSVAQRTREIGVRIAIGARPRDILRQVGSRALPLAAFGIAVGVIGAVLFARLLASMLYRMSPNDPSTYVEVSAGLLVVTLTAAWVPSWRAARVDPTVALRE